MIKINCSTPEEADNVIEAFELLLFAIPEEANPISYNLEDVSINVNDEPYTKWGSFIDNINSYERNDE